MYIIVLTIFIAIDRNKTKVKIIMNSRELLILLCLLAVSASQEDDNTCSVIVMSKEELAGTIRSQVTVALSRGVIDTPVSSTCSLNETVVTRIVERSMNELLEKVEKLIKPIATKLSQLEQPGIFPSHPASSCKEIHEYDKSTPSGNYWLRASNGTAIKIHCDMTWTCGGVTGGWIKIAELDMTNLVHQCPETLSAHIQSGKRICARKTDAAGCTSVIYPTHGVGYNEVCGRVIGYELSTPDGANNYYRSSINGPYIDGISLTYGSPRRHIWSFVAGLKKCDCTNNNNFNGHPTTFVGQDYFCDDAAFTMDPLWDKGGCGPETQCCTRNLPPWFYKNLAPSSSNNIEMRICQDEPVTNEDVLLEKIDLYIR